MHTPTNPFAPFTLLLTVLALHPAVAADWPQWRGPKHNGVSAEHSGWPAKAWPPGEPIWKANVGSGGSSPIVGGGKLYTLGWKQGKDHVACFDPASGKELWSVSYPCREYGRHATGDEGVYSGPGSTPAYDANTGYLHTLSTDGDLNCWDTATQGRKVWGVNLNHKYGVTRRPKVGRRLQRDYGYTSSPLLHGDWLLIEVGAKDGNLMAFDRKTGERAWTSECKDPAGHNCGAVPIIVEGVPCVAVLTIHQLVIVRMDKGNEGKTIATYPWETDFANNVASPVVVDNFVLITSEYNHNAICKLRITLKGAERVWQKSVASKVCTPVVYNDHIYWSWRSVKCLDWKTGELKWQGGDFSDPGSCIVTSDGRLIVWGGRLGKLALVETAERSPQKYSELAVRDKIFGTLAWPHVALSGGRLYCRDRSGNLHCYQVRP